MRVLYFFLILIPLVAPAQGIDRRDVVNILERLDEELSRSETYLLGRTCRIDSLRGRLENTGAADRLRRLDLLLSIGDLYSPYRVDTALHYYKSGFILAHEEGLDSVAARFAMRRAEYLPLLLHIQDAESIADSLRMVKIPKGLLSEFYDSQRQMASYISGFYVSDSLSMMSTHCCVPTVK